jgi:hypothetical protein
MLTTWSDTPIGSRAEDTLARAPYAIHAARLIEASHSWDDSIVLGLTGSWGSGKSSMLNMVAEELEKPESNWCVARFTPWATGDVSGLLEDFYASLEAALPTSKRNEARKIFGKLARISAPAAKLIPVVGEAAATGVSAAADALLQQRPWNETFQEAASALKAIQRPVLVIADDIDRLQTEELLTLLKVVRLLGRFPGVQYLLAYDEDTLFQTLSHANLSGVGVDAATRYMEKIVQYPLAVPPLLRPQLLARLNTGIEEAIADSKRPQIAGDRLPALANVCVNQMRTPRAIDRFLAQLRHHLPLLLPTEIDDEDVIALTLLRSIFPAVHAQLLRWRHELIRGFSGELVAGSSENPEQFDPTPLLSQVPGSARGDALTLLKALFPNLEELQSHPWRGTSRRICDEAYFDRYFAMGIPTHDIADTEVALALEEAANGNGAAFAAMLTETDAERCVLAIAKSESLFDSVVAGVDRVAQVITLLELMIPLLDRVPASTGPLVAPRAALMDRVCNLLLYLDNETSTGAVRAIFALCPTVQDELDFLEFALRRRSPAPPWLLGVRADFAKRATRDIIHNLRARDEASYDAELYQKIRFLHTYREFRALVSQIEDGINVGDFTIGDVAARCVQTAEITDGTTRRTELYDIEREWFITLVPDAEPQRFEGELGPFDKKNTSWAGRRAFAAAILS